MQEQIEMDGLQGQGHEEIHIHTCTYIYDDVNDLAFSCLRHV